MEKESIEKIVFHIVKEYYQSIGVNEDITNDTHLIGKNSLIDSMGLVSIIVDIESAFLEEGFEILLASENAMSRSKSPFISITTLTEFIDEQLNSNISNNE